MEIDNWLTNIQDWLLPRLCPACNDWAGPGRILCKGCERSLPRLGNACPRCATPYEHDHIHILGDCGVCQRHPPAFVRTIALYRYAPPADHFIRALKFHRQLGLARLLGEQLAARLRTEPHLPDLILPVPLHVADALQVSLAVHDLRRVRATLPQSDLPFDARRKNVKGAFTVRDTTALRGRHVALVDDVMTTGNTAEAAARTLLAAGAEAVEVWVIARA
jgi:predicted amidophosphoribosyltransferase